MANTFIDVEEPKMFDDIGGKLKTLTMITCWIGMSGSIVGAIALCRQLVL